MHKHTIRFCALILVLGCASQAESHGGRAEDSPPPIRIAVRSSGSMREISPLSYKGGFETKTLLYETLVERDADGRIVPALAHGWRFENGGRECVFELRVDARFHDGSPVTAGAVAEHFRCWVGLAEHDWLPCNRRILAVKAEGPLTLRVVMSEPQALLPDLCAINPCAICAPAALDSAGDFVEPVGSGPFAWAGIDEAGKVLHYSRRASGEAVVAARIALVRFVNEEADVPVDELLAGRLDAVFDTWRERIPRQRIAALRADPSVRVLETAGSSVVSLGFRTEAGPCADVTTRKMIRGALDASELIERAEHGFADPCNAFAAPTVRVWPRAGSRRDPLPPASPLTPPLRLVARAGSDFEPALAAGIAAQLEQANLPVDVVLLRGEAMTQAVESGAFDLRIESSWGVPYDPDISLASRFGPRRDRSSSDNPPAWGRDARITELVVEAQREWDEARRAQVYAKIQAEIDERAVVVPLYVPRRFVVLRADLPDPDLDHDLYRIDAASLVPATNRRQP